MAQSQFAKLIKAGLGAMLLVGGIIGAFAYLLAVGTTKPIYLLPYAFALALLVAWALLHDE